MTPYLHTIRKTLNGINNKLPMVGLLCLTALATVALSGQIIAGTFMRPIGDDYSLLYIFHDPTQHWLQNMASYLLHTNGRYMQNITYGVMYGILGHKLLTITALVSVFMISTGFYAVLPLLLPKNSLGGRHYIWLRAACSLILTFSLFFAVFESPFSTSSSFQYVYWATGVLTYTIPLALLLYTLGFIFKNPTKFPPYIYIVCGLVIGLFNEVFGVLSLVALLPVALIHIFGKKRIKPFKELVFLGAGLALATVVIMFSPASLGRQQDISSTIKPLSLHEKFYYAALDTKNIILSTNQISKPLLFASLIAGIFVVLIIKTRIKAGVKYAAYLAAYFWIGLLASLFAISLAIAEGYHAFSLPFRMVILYNFWLTVALFVTGTLAGFLLQRLKIMPVRGLVQFSLLIVVLLAMPVALKHTRSQLQTSINFSESWDSQHDRIVQEAKKHPRAIHEDIVTLGDYYPLTCQDGNPVWYVRDVSAYYHTHMVCSLDGKTTQP